MTEKRRGVLLDKAGETDFLRDLVRQVIQELMDAEVDAHCVAEGHERSGEHAGQRNGYSEWLWDSRMGTMEVAEPRPHHRGYMVSILDPGRAAGQALTAVV